MNGARGQSHYRFAPDEIIEEGGHNALIAGGHYAELYDTYYRHQSPRYTVGQQASGAVGQSVSGSVKITDLLPHGELTAKKSRATQPSTPASVRTCCQSR